MASETLELILKARDMASGAVASLRGGMEKLGDASNQYRSTLDRLGSTANEFKATMASLAAVVGVAGVARSFIEIASSAEKSKLMLTGLMGSAEKANEAFGWLLETSTKAPFSIGAMKDAFVKLQVAGLDPMSGSLETLMDAISAFGGGEQELHRAAIAIQQMAGKGVVSMEELRQQLGEALPTAMKAMAEGMGISLQQLSKQIESGSLQAAEGLSAMMSKLEEWYGGTGVQMMTSWTGLMSNLKVAWEKFVLMLAETGVFEQLKATIGGLLEKIDEMKTSGAMEKWGDRVAAVATSLINLFTSLAGVFGWVINALGPFLPALIQLTVYIKTLQIVFGGLVGLPLTFAGNIFALRDSFKVLMGSGIIQFLNTLRISLLASAAAARSLQVALGATALGAFFMTLYYFNQLIEKVKQYRKDVRELAEAQEWSAEQTEYAADRAEKYNKILQELGFKTMKEFNKAVKEGTVAFNDQTKEWERVTKSAEVQKEAYENLLKAVKAGSLEFVKLREAEAKTLKATIDYEIALEEQKYKNGEISLEKYLNFRKTRTEDYINRIIYLKQMELEALMQDPRDNLDRIKAAEEEIQQLRIQSAAGQIKSQQELTEKLNGEYQKDLDNWEKLQELRLQSLQGRLELQNTIEETMVGQGLMRQSALLDNQLDRLRQFYAERIRIAEGTMMKLWDSEGVISEAYQKAAAEREDLQRELEGKIIESEARINEARKKEELEASEFIAKITKDTAEQQILDQEKLRDKVEMLFQQRLITAEQYYDAMSELDRQYVSEFRAELSEWTKALNEAADIVAQRRVGLQNAVKGLIEDSWSDVKKYFGGWTQAVSTTVNEVQYQIDQFLDKTTWKSYDTFWNATLFGRKMVEMVGTSIYEWTGRVADYINHIKGLLGSLQDQIDSYRQQLMQLRGDRLGELELWYKEEKDKLAEKYSDELGRTAEYYAAMNLLDELYAEKKRKLTEDMKKDEARMSEKENTGRAGSSGFGAGSVPSLPSWVQTIPQQLTESAQAISAALKQAAGEDFPMREIRVDKQVKFEADIKLQTPDPLWTKQWFEQSLWPMFKDKMRLMGVDA